MDELQQRILAAETVIIELTPWIDEGAVLQALELLQDGRRRYAGPQLGVWLRAT
jgi:hypothetical protein